MQIVIDIPEKEYDYYRDASNFWGCSKLREIILNGTPLPKGHKRLIEDNFEAGPVFDKHGNRVGYQYISQEDLSNATTIIEADTESRC